MKLVDALTFRCMFQKSSAERTRKAKALEIIAQTKADMTSSKVVTLSEQVGLMNQRDL